MQVVVVIAPVENQDTVFVLLPLTCWNCLDYMRVLDHYYRNENFL